MRYDRQISVSHLAPAADTLAPQLDKIDRPVVLVVPFRLHDFSLVLIDLNDRTWADDRKHGAVGESHEAVCSIAQIHVLEQPNRNLAPDPAELAEKACPIEPELLFQFHRNEHGVITIRDARV